VSDYYNRDGQAITAEEWMKLSARSYRRVASTDLPDGRWLSTVWLGIDHNYGVGRPLIFETMLFPSPDDLDEQGCWRWHDEMTAIVEHARIAASIIGQGVVPP
jgi:hypothetical protein